MKAVKSDLFVAFQESDGYLFDSRATLKKRIQTRTGDPVEYKLANDIHCLAYVLDGAAWDDLREVVYIPKANRRANLQSAANMSVCVFSFADIEELKRTSSH